MNLNFNNLIVAFFSVFLSSTAFTQTACDASFSYNYTECDSIFFSIDSVNTQATYTWYFGDGNSGNGYYTQNQYAADGSYTVTVVMTDQANGCSDTVTTTVNIDCANNCVLHSNIYTVDSTNCSVHVEAAPASGGTPPYTYSWSFGDGNSSSGQYAVHNYANGGAYNLCLTVTDSNGCDTTFCESIIVDCNNSTNCTVTPDFTYSQDSLGCGYYFNSSIFGGTAPFSYYWDFGDGATSVAENPYHPYNSSGTYNVCLTVFDANGCDSSWCETVIVNCTPNNNCIMHPYFTASSDSSSCGMNFNSSNSGGTTPYSYYWDFGDGATSYAQHPNHSFNGSGTYTVCLTITDASGCDSTYCDNVTLNCGTLQFEEKMEQTVEVKVFPNPTNGIFTVDVSAESEIEIYSVSGKMIQSLSNCKGKTAVDITSEAKGIYLIRIVSSQQAKTVRLIKQ